MYIQKFKIKSLDQYKSDVRNICSQSDGILWQLEIFCRKFSTCWLLMAPGSVLNILFHSTFE